MRTYLLQDGLGSTAGLTDGSDSVTDTYIYDAFDGSPWFAALRELLLAENREGVGVRQC